MRVLHLISTLDIGGAEQNLSRLVTAMDRGSFTNQVVCMTRPGPLGPYLEGSGIPVHSLHMRKGLPELRAVLKLRFWASLFKPDAVQCWMYHANLLGLTLMKPAKTLWNIRCSDMDLSRYGPLYRLTVASGARLSRIPSAIVTNSHAGREAHTSLGYRPRKWVIIPNGFDTEIFKPDREAGEKVRKELGIDRDALLIGLIARFDPMKDHACFFEAANMLLDSNSRIHFILAGRGISPSNRDLLSLINTDRHAPRIHLLGERSDVPHVLNALDIATSSSVSEGLPNIVGEAMASALPCAVTDAGDSKILVGDAGFVIPKKNPRMLCAAWQRILDLGPDGRRQMGERARKRIIDHYSLASMVSSYEALYKSLMTEKGSSETFGSP
ncbi:MAG TPA: glycosyltransferase [Deltaproteobacteria bacterium]|jgi:glycosyltransferase involved in cell wall biosynthesis|nr:glycosyltransferase [Deltaproteobacteria bacterium]